MTAPITAPTAPPATAPTSPETVGELARRMPGEARPASTRVVAAMASPTAMPIRADPTMTHPEITPMTVSNPPSTSVVPLRGSIQELEKRATSKADTRPIPAPARPATLTRSPSGAASTGSGRSTITATGAT